MGVIVSKANKIAMVMEKEYEEGYTKSLTMNCLCKQGKRTIKLYDNPRMTRLFRTVEKRMYNNQPNRYIVHCDVCIHSTKYLVCLFQSKLNPASLELLCEPRHEGPDCEFMRTQDVPKGVCDVRVWFVIWLLWFHFFLSILLFFNEGTTSYL